MAIDGRVQHGAFKRKGLGQAMQPYAGALALPQQLVNGRSQWIAGDELARKFRSKRFDYCHRETFCQWGVMGRGNISAAGFHNRNRWTMSSARTCSVVPVR